MPFSPRYRGEGNLPGEGEFWLLLHLVTPLCILDTERNRKQESSSLLAVPPEVGHVLQRLALRLGHELPHKQGGHHADDAIQPVGKHVAEAVAHAARAHVVHRQEGGRDDEVEYPLERHRHGHRRPADGVGEYLGNEYPADGSPAEHEGSAVHHDAHHRHNSRHAGHHVADGHPEGAYRHARRAAYQQGLAPQLFHRKHRQEGKQQVHDAHEDGLHHRVAHAHRLKDARGEVEHGIDAHRLLEHAQHDAHEDNHPAVSEQPLGLLLGRRLDVGKYALGGAHAVDARQHVQRLVVLPVHGQVAGRLGHQQHQQGKDHRRHHRAEEHQPPARLDGPGGGLGIQNLVHPFHGLDDRIHVIAQDEEVHNIDYQLAGYDGKLVPRHQRAPDVAGSHLGNVHRADGRSQAHPYAADDAVQVEGNEQPERGLARLKEQELRVVSAQRRHHEQDARQEQRLLAPQPGGKEARQRAADDAPYQGAGRGYTMHRVGVRKVLRTHEEGLQTLFRARDDRRVVAEQQPADDRHQDNGKKVGLAAFVCSCIFHDNRSLETTDGEPGRDCLPRPPILRRVSNTC